MKQFVFAFALVILSCFSTAQSRADQSEVLFISSYHPSFHSFLPQVNGLKEVLVLNNPGITLDIEFIDAKRYPGQDNLESFRTRLAHKMARDTAPDVLIVGDDIAFRFAISEREKLFANIPIVFLGVNNTPVALEMNKNPQVTGVIEKASFGETLELAMRLTRDDGKVYAITDPTRTGRINLNEFTKTAEYIKYQDRIEVLSLITMSFDELKARLRGVEPGSVINLLSAFQDAKGMTISGREVAALLRENASVPFLHAWETHLGEGSMGGVVISHHEQGRRAGELAAAILRGEKPSELPVADFSPNKLVIDYTVMEKFGIDKTLIPEGATFINAPKTLLGNYGKYVILAGVFVAIQSGAIFLLVILNRKRRRAEDSLRESQKRFRDFANSSSDWFWEMDSDLRFSYFSDRFEEVTGVSPTKLLGKTREETGIPGVDRQIWEDHLEALRQHKPFREFIHPRDKDGGTVWVAISGEPAFDPDGNFLGYRGTGADITERRAADEALREALRTTEQANQSKSNFLAMMSHEFRTPLNAILGFSDILRNQVFGPLGNDQYKEYAADIHDSGTHMLALVNDVLDISAVEAGKREFEWEDIEVQHLLDEAARSLRQYAIDRDIKVEVVNDERTRMLTTDRRAVMQILYNLLSNAIKYTNAGGRVVVSSGEDDDGVIIQVKDTGVGISANKLPGITEAFTRSHADPLIAQEEGTGLGLAIVQALIEELGATLSFESAVGQGTTATVKLPANAQKTEDVKVAQG